MRVHKTEEELDDEAEQEALRIEAYLDAPRTPAELLAREEARQFCIEQNEIMDELTKNGKNLHTGRFSLDNRSLDRIALIPPGLRTRYFRRKP